MTRTIVLALASVLALAACGSKTPTDSTTAPAANTSAAPAAPLSTNAETWSPEALEELLAPVALYPDPVLIQVLTAATNPQEVLDAGNWLIANPNLSGKSLDVAAEKAGFTPPIRGLVQSPEVVDQMCQSLDWTEQLGQAYVNDQAGVMDAVQRLRKQAQDVGTLKSSPQMKVSEEKPAESGGDPVIALTPPKPDVVYVPQYDPVAAYNPPAAASAPVPVTATAPAATTSSSSSGHSTGSLIATGVLAFGAGILVNEIFDDDDDYWHGYNDMWYRPPPYYPPYPYRPVYGPGFYPGTAYNRPNTYIRNNNVVVVNKNNDYWNRYDNDRVIASNRTNPRSPITDAKPNRSDLNNLNARAAQGPKRAPPKSADAWKGQSTYAGKDPAKRAASLDRAKAEIGGSGGVQAKVPKVQGTYAGARPAADRPSPSSKPALSKPAGNAAGAARPDLDRKVDRKPDAPRPVDRAPDRPKPAAPQVANRQAAPDRGKAISPPNRSAVSNSSGGMAQRAASDRGRASTANRAPPKAQAHAKSAGAAHKRR